MLIGDKYYKVENDIKDRRIFKYMKKIKLFMCASIALATILGVYAQSISYYISNTFVKISPLYCLTIITMVSIALFLIPPILILKAIKNQRIQEKGVTPYLIISSLIGVLVSIFSLFVLIMWWS